LNLKKLIKNTAIYTITKYFVMVLGFIKSILVAKYLGPTLLGKYAFISLFVEYLSYYNLGVYGSMNREVSINYGDPSKEKYINKVFNTSLTFSLCLLIPLITLIILFINFSPNFFSADFLEYIYIILALVFFVQFRWFFIRYYRLYERYKVIITFEIISNITLLFGVIFFVPKYSLDGLLVTLLISNVIVLIVSIVSIKNKINFVFDLKLIKKLVLTGLPILFYTLGEKFFTSVDRIMIVSYFTMFELGQYQLGKTFAYGVLMSLDAALFIFYPKVLKFFNLKEDSSERKNKKNNLMMVSHYFDVLTMPIIIVGIIILPLIIINILPQYSESIFIMRILLLAYGFQNFAFSPSSYLVSNGKQNKLVIIVMISLLLMIVSNLLVINLNYGIQGIVIATACVFFVNSALMFIACLKDLGSKILVELFELFWKRIIIFIISIIVIIKSYNIFFILLFYLLFYFYSSFKSLKKLLKLI